MGTHQPQDNDGLRRLEVLSKQLASMREPQPGGEITKEAATHGIFEVTAAQILLAVKKKHAIHTSVGLAGTNDVPDIRKLEEKIQSRLNQKTPPADCQFDHPYEKRIEILQEMYDIMHRIIHGYPPQNVPLKSDNSDSTPHANQRTVFVSYDTYGLRYRDRLLKWSSAKGFTYVYCDDTRSTKFDSGESQALKTTVTQTIGASDLFLCLIGQQTYRSPWVRWEIEQAASLKTPVIVVRMNSIDDVPPELEYTPVGAWIAGGYGSFSEEVVKEIEAAITSLLSDIAARKHRPWWKIW